MTFKSLNLKLFYVFLSTLLIAFSLVACGGGSGDGAVDTSQGSGESYLSLSGQTPADNQVAGISGTGIVFGEITAFGSIYVNGVKYEIDDSTVFSVDGDSQTSEQNLSIGMVVKLNIEKDVNGVISTTSVFFDEAIEGPVQENPVYENGDVTRKIFSIFGQQVVVDSVATTFVNTSFDTLTKNDVVEISGFIDQLGDIQASFVKKKSVLILGSTEVELHGAIKNYSVDTSLEINGVLIHLTPSTEYEDLDTGLQNDLFVEVIGTVELDGSVTAKGIEGEDDDINELKNSEGEISLHGLISAIDQLNREIIINGITIKLGDDISTTTINLLSVGDEVEVEGVMQNTILMAEELEIRGSSGKIEGIIKSIDSSNSSVDIGFNGVATTVTLIIDDTSKLEDDSDAEIEKLKIEHLSANDIIEVDIRKVEQQYLVVVLKREKEIDEYEIEGELTAFDAISKTVTLFGEVFQIDSTSQPTDVADFFTQVEVGDIIEIKDINLDGSFDEVEIDD